jgi:mRNA interferase YafQ
MLATDKSLPEKLSDHGLGGQWRGYRDCHIKPDLLLLYEKPKGKLRLVRLGSHSELFG